MLECTNQNCKKSVLTALESKPIPKVRGTQKFLKCSQCSNVMIGVYSNGVLKSVKETPTDKSAKTIEMIKLAYELFENDAGIKVKLTENGKMLPVKKLLKEKEVSESTAMEPCSCCLCKLLKHSLGEDTKEISILIKGIIKLLKAFK